MKKFTKIVATVSDKRCDVDFIRSLVAAGVNVVRMNSAHLEYEGFRKIIANTRAADDSIAIMLDTKGPEVRTTATASGEPIEIKAGQKMIVVGDPEGLTTPEKICLNYADIAHFINTGDRLLIDDGELSFVVDKVEENDIFVTAENDGELGLRKSVNIPGVALDLPSVTERDARNIGYGVELGVDFIAHSFVRSRQDVEAVQKILDSYDAPQKIISKIENQEGIDNFDEILDASYGIMVARGDLGIEVPAERIPGMQNMMVNKCIAAHKPVIVATQMLHTMIEHPRPTRAEISDVANAVYQRADAMMLSGETAYGKYPLEAVRTMAKVAREVENTISRQEEIPPLHENDITTFLARQAVLSERTLGTRAIFTDAFHGNAARLVASFRGINPTFAICHSRNVQRWLALSYGITAYYDPRPIEWIPTHSTDTIRKIVADGLIGEHDRVVYIIGTRAGARSIEFLTPADLFDEENQGK